MEFKDTLNYRQSIRIFKDKAIPEDDLRDIVQLAEKTPSWTNSQPWRVHIATGESLQKIKEDHLRHYELGIHGKPDFPYAPRDSWDQLSQLNSFKWSSELGTFLGEDGEQMGYSNTHLFDAAAIVYLTLPKKGSMWSVYDLGAFGQTLALAAADKRIDSVVAYEFIKYPDSLRKILGVSNDTNFVMGIGLGYRDNKYKINKFRSSRDKVDEILNIHK